MKYYTYKLDLLIMNILAVVLMTFLMILTCFITKSVDFIDKINVFTFVCLFFWCFLHELLHGIGFIILGKVNKKNIVFGVELEKGIFYCMCKEKVTKANILIALLFPVVFIGIFTYLIGIYFGSTLLIILSILNISCAIGDLLMALDICLMPNDIFYIDLDDTTSFTILSKNDLSKNKYFSIILNKHGKYNDSIRAKDYTKLKISKGSKYFIVFFIILFMISILGVLGS